MVPASINQEAPQLPVPEPARRFLDSLATLDVDQVTQLLSEDVRLETRRGIYAAGKARIRKQLMRAITALHSIHCEPAAVWVQENLSVIDADVSCERMDGSRSAFPVTLILGFRGGLISVIRLFTYEPAVVGLLA